MTNRVRFRIAQARAGEDIELAPGEEVFSVDHDQGRFSVLLADNPDYVPYDRSVMHQTMIDHQRVENGGCSCGFAEPGASFAGHVLDTYEEAIG